MLTMRTKFNIIIASFLGINAIFGDYTIAQNKHFTMEEAVLGLRGGALMADNLKQLQWIPNSQTFTQVVTVDKQQYLVSKQAKKAATDTLLSTAQLNTYFNKADSLKSLPAIIWNSANSAIFSIKNDWYQINFNQNKFSNINKLKSFPANAENITFDDHKRIAAYTIDNNLYLTDAYNKTHTISQEKNPAIVYGQTVHRSEFGIHNGIFFSPKGNLLAFYRMDESMVSDYPIINWSTVPASNQNIKYPMAGGTSHQVTVGIYNPINKKTTYLQTTGPKDQYLTNISWSPDEKYVFVAVLNRGQDYMQLNQYDAHTGSFIKTLFEERSNKYVEPQNPLYFINDQEFLWFSQRDGFMHLYRYNIAGKLLNVVTKGHWLVNDIVGINKASKQVIITANKQDPREKHIYAVSWINGKMQHLSKEPGMHTAFVSSDGQYILDHFTNESTPRKIQLLNVSGKVEQTLLKANDKLAAYERPSVQNVVLKADDGTDLFGKLILPKNIDSSKKYPVIVYLYNGPHLQLITNTYPNTGNLWYDYLTQRDYIVFTMDGRGSSNRGFAFESATFQQLGAVEMKDQLAGVAYLANLPFVDMNRLGIHGWSFGGFMTTSLMTNHPEVFKAGVAGGPVIEWDMYEVMYTERYMNTPQENPTGYAQTGLLKKANQLKGKLLMIHGANDDVVVWQHSLRFIEAAVKANKQVDYYAYPGHKHNVMGKDRVHLMQKITDYFDLHLKP